jgi:hypothetical protein
VPTTGLAVCNSAFKQAQLDQELTSFGISEFPYNCALDILNDVLREISKTGAFWFLKKEQFLPYQVNTSTYNLAYLANIIDPKRIVSLARTKEQKGTLQQINDELMRELRNTNLETGVPTRYALFNQTLWLNAIPEKDYGLLLVHYDDMPLIVTETDNLPLPDDDIDTVIAGVYAYLLQRLGRGDFGTAYQLYDRKLKRLLRETRRNYGLPQALPALF